ncbi:putative MFS family arabinose efflux permease [Pseudonocardia hierapolitana]|uniref:Putative MFS family arabinose efflux permease n=1 Tax=Pseudonocardia hierapolitana TaxID=1128676 RepID=A0A561SHW1_9PSEU|nr:MFS transporter [Pseudonocardia hierapolitana]TWF74385.1 putative MFS family arabinose efflux permease [Pseudonocardia hierapolitana]
MPAQIALQRRILVVLAAAQVLGGVGVATTIAVSSLVASRLSGSEAVGGLAQTGIVLGAAAASFVVSRVATRSGRRPALSAGYAVAALGGTAAVVAVSVGSAPALLVALVLVGSATAAGLAARFAATDLAAPEGRARALAMVVWATTVGAVAGPNLAGPVQGVAGAIGLEPATGPFLLCACAFTLAAFGTWVGLRPDPLLLARGAATPDTGPPPRAAEVRAALLASPGALLGLGGIVVGHLIMVGLMSMTPVHMDHGGATLAVVGLVISLHVAGMYALSPLFGWLADRVGRPPVLALAAALLLGAGVLSALAGPADTWLLTAGLVLLGLGWSGGLVAGSALLSESVPIRVRAGVQGLSDVAMNVSGAVGGIAAGVVVAGVSYAALGVAAAVIAVPYLVAASSAGRRTARQALS